MTVSKNHEDGPRIIFIALDDAGWSALHRHADLGGPRERTKAASIRCLIRRAGAARLGLRPLGVQRARRSASHAYHLLLEPSDVKVLDRIRGALAEGAGRSRVSRTAAIRHLLLTCSP